MKTKIVTTCLLIVIALTSCTPASPTEVVLPTNTPPPPTLTPTPEPITPIRLGEYELLSPEDMRSDLDELFHRIETTHPNPYTKRPKVEVDLERQSIYDELDQPMTMFDFYNKVVPLIVSLGDFHSQLILPPEIFREVLSKEKFLPLGVEFDGERGLITVNYTGNTEIPSRAELLSVNGVAISNIQSELSLHNLRNNYPFPSGLWILYGSIPEYELEILRPGETTSVKLTIPSLTAEASSKNAPPAQPWEPVTYSKIPGEPIGVLVVNTFEGIGPLLKSPFAQIQNDDVVHLIIDIRANNGGKYQDVGALMDYLTDQAYTWCSKSYEAPFGGYGSGAPREMDCETIEPFDTTERFQGKLYLLIGPQTFSAAITFATILQDHGLATIIGEETTDTASYCANIPDPKPLPRTGLMYTLSKTCYVRPSGVLDDLPVIPDIVVETTIEDQIAGRDPVLEYTLDMIRSGQTP